MIIEELEKRLKKISTHFKLIRFDIDNQLPLEIDYAPENEEPFEVYNFSRDYYYLKRISEYVTNDQLNVLLFLINQWNDEHFKTNNPFKKYTDDLADTLLSKNKAYGDSFTKSIDKYGLPVIGIRLSDKYNRIEHLITNNEFKENDESLADTLLDTAGYSILALKYLKEHENEISKN
ncbi:nucleotide modification associated domain-containing protein [Lactobacillus kalixensis]|uniref:Uncharacterized protein n=1 Tax=Lactobacillus kalixensis DSM 16043 TaxID=1423763 RepID=A0A0R1U7N9_9LACO|nr:nucleotide modification associated domain-containing protein [Lactobacillus kalixensis]KRL88676.1 hypothetical protein FC46_GL001429 [Lactobacillus kalixensis DSM 16043]